MGKVKRGSFIPTMVKTLSVRFRAVFAPEVTDLALSEAVCMVFNAAVVVVGVIRFDVRSWRRRTDVRITNRAERCGRVCR